MDPVLDRLELLERRVTALERGNALAPGDRLRPQRSPERVESGPPVEVAPPLWVAPPPPLSREPGPSAFGPVLSGDAPRAEPSLTAPAPATSLPGRRPEGPGPLLPEVTPPMRRAVSEQAPARAAAPARDLESWFGTVVLGRLGIAAVVLAAAYFAQLAYRNVGDAVKVLSLYALGGALVAVGHFVRTRVGPRFVGLLWGGATAVTYIAGVAATLRYQIVGPWTGVALLAAAAALGQLLSRALKQQAIATVSVVGAMAAPFLLGVAQSPGPWLLIYAAGVHAWAAWAERAFGWTWGRGAALVGSLALSLAWSWGPCLGDVPTTFLALHVFALAVMAPELVSIWRGEAPRLWITAILLSGVALLDLALFGNAIFGEVPRGLLLSGGAWLGLAVVLAGRATPQAARTLVRGLAGLGGVVLAAGAVVVWEVRWHGSWAELASLAALAPLLLLLRRRVGAGDAGVVAASILAYFIVRGEIGGLIESHARTIAAGALTTFPMLLLGLVPAAALTGVGRNPALRATGLIFGAATLAFPFVPYYQDVVAWAAVGLTLPALWALAGHERARSTGDAVLALTAKFVALTLAATWAVGLTTLDRALGWPNALDPHTVSALALAGVLLTMRLRPFAGSKVQRLSTVLMAGAIGLLLLAGGREVHLLTREFPPAEHSAAMALFLAGAALVLALHARTGNRLGRAATGIGCLFAAALVSFTGALEGAHGSPLVLALLGVGLAAGLVTEILLRRRGERPTWLGAATVPLLLLGLAWFTAAQLAVNAPATPIMNHRFLAGAGLTLLFAGTLWSTVRAGGPNAGRWATGVGMLIVGYLTGLYELVLATEPLHGAWSPVLVSLYTAAFAVVMLVGGFGWSLRPLRVAALVMLGIVVAKVGLYDLAASELPLRVLVTGVLGLVLLGSAYAYARRKRTATPEE